ncbi:MAG TPA: hypothetical protein VF069_28830 [Streptosporangiaceae bacterium]
MIGTVTAIWAAIRLRRHPLPELIAAMDRPSWLHRRRPPVTPIVAILRLVAGFAAPMRENAIVVAALRRCRVPAQLVVGADPVPDHHGGYRVYTWIEIAGAPLDADSPPGNYLVEMVRFPKKG